MQTTQSKRLFFWSMGLFLISSAIVFLMSTQLQVMANLLASTSTLPQNQNPTTSPTSTATSIAETTPTQPAGLSQQITLARITRDTFQKADQVQWGAMESTIDWDGDAATNPAFSIQNEHGVITGGEDEPYFAYFDMLQSSNVEIALIGSISQFQGSQMGVLLRMSDEQNWYGAYIDSEKLTIERNLNGQRTILTQVPFQAQDDTIYTLRFRAIEDILAAKVWAQGEEEPSIWQTYATDNTFQAGMNGMYVLLPPDGEATFTEYAVYGVFN